MIEILALAIVLSDVDRVVASDLSTPFPVTWCNDSAQTSDDYTHTVEVYQFPPVTNQLPAATHTLTGDRETWDLRPPKAGVYWLRARTCDNQGECSPWLSTLDSAPADGPDCNTERKRTVYYFQVPPATGGGIDG